MLSLAVSFATWQADHEVLYRENAGLRSQVAKLEVGGSWVLSVLIFFPVTGIGPGQQTAQGPLGLRCLCSCPC